MKKCFTRMLKTELYKAFHNNYFRISLLFGCSCALFSGAFKIRNYAKLKADMEIISGNPMWQMASLYNYWIGGESGTLGYACFFFLLPLLAVLPYGWSYCEESRKNYLKLPVIYGGRRQYFLAKYIAAFLAGGTAIIIPMIANLLMIACVVPAYLPTMEYGLYYPVSHGSLWSELFYTRPTVFVICYLLLDFVFAGLFAALAYAISIFIHNKIAVILLPFILTLILHHSRTFLQYRVYKEIPPLHFLHSTCVENNADAGIILTELLILFAVSIGIVLFAGIRYEDI